MIQAGDIIIWYLGPEQAECLRGLHVARCLDCGKDWGVYASYGPDFIPKDKAVKIDNKYKKWLSVESDLGDYFTQDKHLEF